MILIPWSLVEMETPGMGSGHSEYPGLPDRFALPFVNKGCFEYPPLMCLW